MDVDDKVHKTLDELAKESRKNHKNSNKKNGKRAPLNKISSPNKSNPRKKSNKAATVAAASSVKRNAVINQKRGIRENAKASDKEIRNSVKSKLERPGATLRISFRPQDLNKTTDRSVAAQIKSVLQKRNKKFLDKKELPIDAALSNKHVARNVKAAKK